MPRYGASDDDRPPPKLPLWTRLLISWGTNAIILLIVALLLSNVHYVNVGDLLLAALVFGVLNTIVKPVLRLLTLPFAILTLGIAWFFVSLFMLWLTDALVYGYNIDGFWTYVGATIIVWAANMVLDFTPGPWQLSGKRRRINERASRG